MKKKFIAAALLGASLMMSGCVTITTNSPEGGDNEELRYYVDLNPNVSSHSSDLNETEFAKNLMKKTGVKVKFEHPTTAQGGDSFALMIASEDLPDIIESNWQSYRGGVDKAIADKKIISLNDYLKNEASDLNKLLENNEDVRIAVTTQGGQVFCFPFVRGDEILMTCIGGMIRQDWLDELGLEVPETIDEWEQVLTAFRDKGVKYPVSYSMDSSFLDNAPIFMGAYGVSNTYYRDGDTIKYGPMEEGYKEYLITMNRWYQNGLFDKDFPSNISDSKRLTSLMINGEAGAAFNFCGSGFGQCISGLRNINPDYKLTPVKYPVLRKGDKVEFAQRDLPATGQGAAITTSCKNPKAAAKFLNYGYTEEGSVFYNFGVEGESYVKGGNDYTYTYTDKVTDPSVNGGLSVAQAISKYARACYDGPFIQHKDYILQSYSYPEQKAALSLWKNNNMANHLVPAMSISADESAELAKINTEIKTYSQETIFKMIIQPDGMSLYDDFINNLKQMGIERAIEIKQKAYDRVKTEN